MNVAADIDSARKEAMAVLRFAMTWPFAESHSAWLL